MMISPEGYYEQYLKGKTKEQIMTAIRGLKQEIGHLKNVMEHPDYGSEAVMHPSESTRLYWTREYLKRAKVALVEAGGEYKTSMAEKKAEDFNEHIDDIHKIVFGIGGFHQGYNKYIIEFTDDSLISSMERFGVISDWQIINMDEEPASKQDILDTIKSMHIGEWRTSYTLERFGYHVCDGTQWELEIYFSNEHKPVKIYGDNAYPYNFDVFQGLLGIVPDIDEQEE